MCASPPSSLQMGKLRHRDGLPSDCPSPPLLSLQALPSPTKSPELCQVPPEASQPHSTQPEETGQRFKLAHCGDSRREKPSTDSAAYLSALCPPAATHLPRRYLSCLGQLVPSELMAGKEGGCKCHPASEFSRYCFHGAAVRIRMILDKQQARCQPSGLQR